MLRLVSGLLCGENESRNSANTGKLALFFQMQASSDPVSLQSDVSLSSTSSCFILTTAGGQFEGLQGVTLNGCKNDNFNM